MNIYNATKGLYAIQENIRREGLWATIKTLLLFVFVFVPFLTVSVLNELQDPWEGLEQTDFVSWTLAVWIGIFVLFWYLLAVLATASITLCNTLNSVRDWASTILLLHFFFILHLSGLIIQVNSLFPESLLIEGVGDFRTPIYWLFEQYLHGTTFGLLLPYNIQINEWESGNWSLAHHTIATGVRVTAAFWSVVAVGTATRILVMRLWNVESESASADEATVAERAKNSN